MNTIEQLETDLMELAEPVMHEGAELAHSVPLLENTTFWVLVAFVVFCVIAFRFGRQSVLGTLDSRTNKIRSEIEEAERLKGEAQDLLAEYQRKHRDAVSEAENILKIAQDQAELIKQEAFDRLQKQLKTREEQASAKIQLAEEQAIRDVRNQIIDVATAAAADILAKQNEGKAGDDLVDQSIDEIRKKA